MTTQSIQGALSVEEAANYLSVSRAALYRLMSSGQVPSLHIGKRRVVRREDLDAFLESRLAAETPR